MGSIPEASLKSHMKLPIMGIAMGPGGRIVPSSLVVEGFEGKRRDLKKKVIKRERMKMRNHIISMFAVKQVLGAGVYIDT